MNTQMDPTSEIWVNTKITKKPDTIAIYAPKFPHMGFICPVCGSVDVFVSWNGQRKIEGQCLDCSHKWNEGQTTNEVSYRLD